MNLKQEVTVWSIIYILSSILYYTVTPYISGIILISLAVTIYVYRYKCTLNFVDMQGIFGLAWIGGQGLACFQLSRLQQQWSVITWLSFGIAYVGFVLAFRVKNSLGREKIQVCCRRGYEQYSTPLLHCIFAVVALSLMAFFLEAYIVGYIPIFVDFAHAYSYFHVSGVHYFTVSCVFIPVLSVLYWFSGVKKKKVVCLVLANIIAVGIPVLCVSRFQLIFEVGFAVIAYFTLSSKIKWRTVIGLGICLVIGYGVLSVFRNHDASYLNDIFEMKNSELPVAFSQPYIYIVNNYENYNCLVENLSGHTWGLKMLFPLFGLTGLKFVFPELVTFPIYITKDELNTYTMFYDAYYDFGVVGVFALAVLIGFACRKIYYKIYGSENPIWLLIGGQLIFYLGLSFFTTWFSLTTTWFWIILTILMYLYMRFYTDGYSVRGMLKH